MHTINSSCRVTCGVRIANRQRLACVRGWPSVLWACVAATFVVYNCTRDRISRIYTQLHHSRVCVSSSICFLLELREKVSTFVEYAIDNSSAIKIRGLIQCLLSVFLQFWRWYETATGPSVVLTSDNELFICSGSHCTSRKKSYVSDEWGWEAVEIIFIFVLRTTTKKLLVIHTLSRTYETTVVLTADAETIS